MAEGLSFRIGADVNDALRGLQQVEQRMRGTAAAGQSFGMSISKSTESVNSFIDILGKQFERLQRIASMPGLSFRQQERLNGLLISTQAELGKAKRAADLLNTPLSKLPKSSNEATQSLINLSRVAQDAPYGFIGIANNINPLLESFQRLKATTGTTGGAFKALRSTLIGPAGIGLAVGVVSSLLVVLGDKLFGSSKKAKELREENKKLADSISGDIVKLTSLVAVYQNVNTSQEDRRKALQAINQEYAKYIPNLEKEGITAGNLAKSYDQITDSLLRQAIVKGLQDEIEKKVSETAASLIALEKAEAKRRAEEQKGIQQGKQRVSVDSVIARDLQRFNSIQNDGVIAQQRAEVATRANIAAANDYDTVLARLKDRLKKDLEPLFGIIGQFKFEDLKIDLKPEKLKKEIEDQFAKIEPLEIPIEIIPSFGATIPIPRRATTLISKQLIALENDLKPIVPKIEFDPLKATPEFTEGLKRIKDELLQTAAVGQFVGKTLADGFGSAFDAIQQGENVLIAFGESIKQVVLDLIKLAIQTLIIRAITNLFAPGLGSIGGLTGGASSLFGGFRAGGGPVEAGRAYVVGENRPELFVPNVSGRIVPSVNPGISTGGRSSFGGNRQYVRGSNLVLVTARTNRSQGR